MKTLLLAAALASSASAIWSATVKVLPGNHGTNVVAARYQLLFPVGWTVEKAEHEALDAKLRVGKKTIGDATFTLTDLEGRGPRPDVLLRSLIAKKYKLDSRDVRCDGISARGARCSAEIEAKGVRARIDAASGYIPGRQYILIVVVFKDSGREGDGEKIVKSIKLFAS